MIDRAILSTAVAILLMILAVALLLLVLPLFQRLAFDLICQDYVRRMDAGGGLTSGQLAALAAELAGQGYTVDRLEVSGSVPFGGDLILDVQVSKLQRRVSPALTMEDAIVCLRFTRTVICRKIVTAAGEP